MFHVHNRVIHFQDLPLARISEGVALISTSPLFRNEDLKRILVGTSRVDRLLEQLQEAYFGKPSSVPPYPGDLLEWQGRRHQFENPEMVIPIDKIHRGRSYREGNRLTTVGNEFQDFQGTPYRIGPVINTFWHWHNGEQATYEMKVWLWTI